MKAEWGNTEALAPSFTVTGQWMKDMRQPIVYVWRRGDQVLYVGMGSRGLCRPLGSHNKLVSAAIRADDALDVYRCATPAAAVEMERRLIEQLQPSLNGKYRLPGNNYLPDRQYTHYDLVGEVERCQLALAQIARGITGDPQATAEAALRRR